MGLFDSFKQIMQGNKLDVADRFDLLREAISGTMSDVYKARDKTNGRVVALKILDPEKTVFFESRFKGLAKPAEGKIAMEMSHPLVVTTFEYGMTTKGQQYVIMEFVDGPGLQALIRTRDDRLEGRRAKLVQQMTEALHYVHQKGYIHRDICPRNYICQPDCDSLKLIDFGLTVPATKEFMAPGNRTGTPLYMAPEIVRRKQTDHRLDIFSLGVTAYQVCTYEFPWPVTETSGKAALMHDTADPAPIWEHRPALNKTLGETIMRCLEKDPEKRPSSTDDLLKRLRQVKNDDE
jgi:eukaryotic-like serine/threonine-protein kinase